LRLALPVERNCGIRVQGGAFGAVQGFAFNVNAQPTSYSETLNVEP
jgi:hypothetical protein